MITESSIDSGLAAHYARLQAEMEAREAEAEDVGPEPEAVDDVCKGVCDEE